MVTDATVKGLIIVVVANRNRLKDIFAVIFHYGNIINTDVSENKIARSFYSKVPT